MRNFNNLRFKRAFYFVNFYAWPKVLLYFVVSVIFLSAILFRKVKLISRNWHKHH